MKDGAAVRMGETVWNGLCAKWGVFSVEERPSVLNGEGQIDHTRALAVEIEGTYYLPGYQFNANGDVYPAMADVLSILRDAGWPDFSIAVWLAYPTGWLSGDSPADLLYDDASNHRLLTAVSRRASA